MKGGDMNYILTKTPFLNKADAVIAMMFVAFAAMLIAVYIPEITSSINFEVGGSGLYYNQIP